MKRLSFFKFLKIGLLLLIVSCNLEIRAKRGELADTNVSQQREWLKQIALCSCIKHGFSQDDSIKKDISVTILSNLTLYKHEHLNQELDSISRRIINNTTPTQIADYDNKKPIMLGCINFYNSKYLDSLVKSYDKYLDKQSINIIKNK